MIQFWCIEEDEPLRRSYWGKTKLSLIKLDPNSAQQRTNAPNINTLYTIDWREREIRWGEQKASRFRLRTCLFLTLLLAVKMSAGVCKMLWGQRLLMSLREASPSTELHHAYPLWQAENERGTAACLRPCLIVTDIVFVPIFINIAHLFCDIDTVHYSGP